MMNVFGGYNNKKFTYKEDFEEMKESERDPYYDYHSRGLSPSDFQ